MVAAGDFSATAASLCAVWHWLPEWSCSDLPEDQRSQRDNSEGLRASWSFMLESVNIMVSSNHQRIETGFRMKQTFWSGFRWTTLGNLQSRKAAEAHQRFVFTTQVPTAAVLPGGICWFCAGCTGDLRYKSKVWVVEIFFVLYSTCLIIFIAKWLEYVGTKHRGKQDAIF